MKKNIFLIILTLVTVFCIIVGASRHLGLPRKSFSSVSSSIRKGLRHGRLSFHFNKYDDDEDEDFDSDDTKTFDTETISEFSALDVNLKVGGLKIERGNKWQIEATYPNSYLKPEYNLKDGKLTISQPDYRNKKLTNKGCSVVITVPFGTELDKVSIKMDVGAVEISGVDIQKGSIDTDVGAIAVSNVDFDDLDLDSDVGAVSIELVEPVENYSINVNSDLGGIVVDGKNVKRRYSQKGSSSKQLRINTDVGGVEVK